MTAHTARGKTTESDRHPNPTTNPNPNPNPYLVAVRYGSLAQHATVTLKLDSGISDILTTDLYKYCIQMLYLLFTANHIM